MTRVLLGFLIVLIVVSIQLSTATTEDENWLIKEEVMKRVFQNDKDRFSFTRDGDELAKLNQQRYKNLRRKENAKNRGFVMNDYSEVKMDDLVDMIAEKVTQKSKMEAEVMINDYVYRWLERFAMGMAGVIGYAGTMKFLNSQ